MKRFKDAFSKRIIRLSYILFCGLRVYLNIIFPKRKDLSVNYAGAIIGDIGGPLVKVKRLNQYFPQVNWGYNLVYILSNCIYLPSLSLKALHNRRTPIVYNQNGVFYKSWYKGDWERENMRMAEAYHIADWVFYQSEFCRYAATRFLGERKALGEVLYNAVDIKHFSPSTFQRESENRSITFLLTGKIGIHLFYRIESSILGLFVARNNGLNCRLIIAGSVDSDAKKLAERLINKHNLTKYIYFSGPYTQMEAPEIYRCADVYIMTKYNDPCPNTVIEAMACGLPILYSKSGGVPELVGKDAGIGLSCPEDWENIYVPSSNDIAEGMVTISANINKYSLAARGRAVSLFNIENWIEKHRHVFMKLLDH